MKSILLVRKLSGLVEMTSGLVSELQLARMASCENDFLCTLVKKHSFESKKPTS